MFQSREPTSEHVRQNPRKDCESYISLVDGIPSNFAGFVALETRVEGDTALHSMACKCGQTALVLSAGSTDNHPEFKNRGVVWLDPLWLECSHCAARVNFFDSRRDGYDGRLNGGCASGQSADLRIVTCSGCSRHDGEIEVRVSYQNDIEEMDEIFQEDAILSPIYADYFDWMSVFRKCPDCNDRALIGDWECA
jgi:hypothetical protein